MREIKFRAWSVDRQKMISHEEHMELSSLVGYDDLINQHMSEEIPLMQFTGLKDKNGTEIYESDIVNAEDGDGWVMGKGKIVFKDGCFMILCISEPYVLLKDSFVEVIGNIYENKELLGE